MTEYTFPSVNRDNTIHCYEWDPEVKPVAILQIVHGMAEHVGRYADFAEFMAKNGVVVAGNDHIGHGKSSDSNDWGYLGPKNLWEDVVEDVEKYRKILDEKYPGVPHFILGHSMGSFITRIFLARYGKGLSGAVVMGTAGENKAAGAGSALVSMIIWFKGERHISNLVTKMAFGKYLDRIPNAKTPYDWLSRDEEVVQKYMDDPACGFLFTAAGYADLFQFIKNMTTEVVYTHTIKDIPIFVVAGEEDPVGAYGAGPKEYYNKLIGHGCNASIKLYPGMRHEILNEIGKEEVYEDMKNFVLGNL